MVGVKIKLIDHVTLFKAPKWPHFSSTYITIWFRIPLFFQYFIHSTILIIGGSICALFHEIVRHTPKKTLSTLSLITGIERILNTIKESLGQRFFYNS